MKEFKLKVSSIFPNIPKNNTSGRTEFENLTDLLQYIIDTDNKNSGRNN